ncbi:MAG TPA: hypothetical protein VMR74_07445 [Gammaproteobacteria bacterium]|nr:hypothetical protein [Gammaproteobacteria bacterium]
MNEKARGAASALVIILGIPALVAPAQAQEQPVPDTFLAITTNMTPADAELKADVIRWSTDEERAAVIAALQSEEDRAAALRELPTVGVVWRSGSAVGHSIKYAHRSEGENGGERITLVTDRPIGFTSFRPWEADDPATDAALDYSVVEMTIGDGDAGQGMMSLSAPVTIDADAGVVSLEPVDAPALLTNVREAPKPYWASQ